MLAGLPEMPLLVISSDMSHVPSDAEARRLDRIALDAVESLDPARLFETVKTHNITMCGLRPAVIVMETLRRLGRLTRCEPVGYATSADVSPAAAPHRRLRRHIVRPIVAAQTPRCHCWLA